MPPPPLGCHFLATLHNPTLATFQFWQFPLNCTQYSEMCQCWTLKQTASLAYYYVKSLKGRWLLFLFSLIIASHQCIVHTSSGAFPLASQVCNLCNLCRDTRADNLGLPTTILVWYAHRNSNCCLIWFTENCHNTNQNTTSNLTEVVFDTIMTLQTINPTPYKTRMKLHFCEAIEIEIWKCQGSVEIVWKLWKVTKILRPNFKKTFTCLNPV